MQPMIFPLVLLSHLHQSLLLYICGYCSIIVQATLFMHIGRVYANAYE